jgi:hypothetical protein
MSKYIMAAQMSGEVFDAATPSLELQGELTGHCDQSDHYAATVVLICEDGSRQELIVLFNGPARPTRARLVIGAAR